MSALDSLLPTLSRSSSLYVSDAPRTVSLLDTSSYSPFPTFPGTLKTSDPYGLSTFLLHPEDALWKYVDPIPDPHASTSSGEEDEDDAPTKSRPQTVRKQKSLGLLRPSPLSQPPIATDETEKSDKQLGRKRSLSMGEETRPSPTQQKEVVDSFRATAPATPVREKSKLKKAFALGRMSGRKSETAPPVPTPPVPTVSTLSLAEDDTIGHPVTPLSTRSSSNSTLSSGSSTCSSDDIKTPAEGQLVEVMIEGKVLANALEEKNKKKGRSVWGWFGGKKIKGDGSQVSPKISAKSTPSSSTTDLLAVPQSSPPESKPQTAINLPSNQFPVEHTYLTNQLRASSLRKIAQLKAPSPHPFALALARQHRKLPDEVALSIQSGRRVFPKSVNSFTGLADLSPAQGGLRLGLAVRDVMIKLDRGEQPQGTIMARRNSKKNLVPRPKGVLDFINRPPFEQRNFVYFPDGVYSPISMARPGYGVWELDFSAYIQGLGELHEVSSMRNVERESKESSKAVQEERIEEVVEMKEVEDVQDPQAALMALTAKETKPVFSPDQLESPSPNPSSPRVSSENLRPFSSLRPISQRRICQSSDDEDDEPLSLTKRRSQLLGAKPSQPSSTSSLDTHVRNLSQPQAVVDPASNRLSCLAPPVIDPQAAMLEVQRARERRELNRRGENEKRAEAERLIEKMRDRNTRGVSMMDLRSAPDLSVRDKMPQHKRASSNGSKLDLAHFQAGGSSPQMRYPPTPQRSNTQPMPTARAHDGQRRSVMSLVDSYPPPQIMLYAPPSSNPGSKRPEMVKAKTELEKDHSKSRFHSFYEQRGGVVNASNLNRRESQVTMVQPHQQDYVQQGATRGSMVLGYGASGIGVGTGDKRSSRMA
ncbi:hypothetical protein AYX13_02327 [Cryptococcus neoformans]|nr:hypothetical protein AYX13_02327 [Cryptococcus neoformans var. grubii]